MTSNEGRAYFALSGYHFNPDDITRLLGIKPTAVNAAGANSGLDKPVISSWELTMHQLVATFYTACHSWYWKMNSSMADILEFKA